MTGSKYALAAAAALALGGASSASAASIQDIFAAMFNEASQSPVNVVVLEDDHFEQAIDNAAVPGGDLENDGVNNPDRIDWVGDRIYGILIVPRVAAGTPAGPGIENVNPTSPGTTLSPTYELSAIFDVAATGFVSTAPGLGYITYGAGGTLGSDLFRLYAQTPSTFNAGGTLASSIASVTDGTLIATGGLSGPGTTFWKTNVANIGGALVPIALPGSPVGEFSLNLGLNPFGTNILPNSLGTQVYGEIQTADPSTTGQWEFQGDVDIKLVLVPTPAAAGAGAALLGLLGGASVLRRRRLA